MTSGRVKASGDGQPAPASGWGSTGLAVLGGAIVLAACSASSGSGGSLAGQGTGGQAGFFGAGSVPGSGAAAAAGGTSGGGTGGDPGIVVPSSGGDTGAGGSGGATTADGGTPTLEPVFIDACGEGNPSGIDAATAQQLMAGGPPDGIRLLNPYDGTVFPRGLISPLLMWDGGGTADLVYVHLKSSRFEYKGCLEPTGANQLQLPQYVWKQAGEQTGGKNDPFTLELTTSAGGANTGTVEAQLVIAQATLKGSIFYNSYSSKLVPATGIGVFTGGNGAVLRMTPGKPAEAYLGQTECTGCHSVSANGTRIVTKVDSSDGATFPVTLGGDVNPTPLVLNAPAGSFAGVFPDGSLYVSNGNPGMGPRGVPTGALAGLYVTDTAGFVADSGIPGGAMAPMFSPDGKLLTFNDFAIANGHGLAVMDFDVTTRKASGYRKVYETTEGYPGWPFFLPDDEAIVFSVGSASDFAGGGLGLPFGGFGVTTGDLYVLDVGSGEAHLLARAVGFDTEADAKAGNTYLPFGAAEAHMNFYPTVSPVAAGGYFWIFFDSFRYYGNTHNNSLVRQLWGAALDISPDGTYRSDPSHPPFYLTGQEDVAGNHRAFTALDPCKNDGDGCSTGIDCCGGFCTDGVCKPPPPPETGPRCAKTDESCSTGLPCCNGRDRCIAGYCGQILQ